MSSTVGSLDQHRLEAPLERGVLLDVLAVLVERGRADAVQLAARQRGLQHVGGVHRALGRAGADQRVQLVDEQDDLALGRRSISVQHGLQALLELAAVLGAGDQRAHVEREQRLSFRLSGTSPLDDALREALDDRGLADAGLADQHGVVLGAPRQHLDGAADLVVPADDGIELAVGRRLGQVAGIALQGVIGLLGRRAVGGAPLADLVDGAVQGLRGDAGVGEDLAGFAALLERDGEQQPLGGDELVACLLGNLLGGIEDAREILRQVDLAGPPPKPSDAWKARAPLRQRGARPAAGTLDEPARQPFLVVEQHLQQMLGRELLVPLADRKTLRRLDEALGPVGILVEIHELPSCGSAPPPKWRGGCARSWMHAYI